MFTKKQYMAIDSFKKALANLENNGLSVYADGRSLNIITQKDIEENEWFEDFGCKKTIKAAFDNCRQFVISADNYMGTYTP